MTIEEIRKNAPDGATCYKFMKHGEVLYFNDNHQYWAWVSKKWIDTRVLYGSEEVKPL